MIRIAVDPFPSETELKALWLSAWGVDHVASFAPVLARSLAHIGAYAEEKLIGFVNVATDGGIHAFILDTCVAPEFRRQGVARRLVQCAARTAGERGARWLHVDFEPHLEGFYLKCGFRPSPAGVMRLGENQAG